MIMLITFALTFLLNPISKKLAGKINHEKYLKYHIHHSVWGMLLFIIGLVAGNKYIAAIGLGVYLGHVAEEAYFNKRNIIRASLIFITR